MLYAIQGGGGLHLRARVTRGGAVTLVVTDQDAAKALAVKLVAPEDALAEPAPSRREGDKPCALTGARSPCRPVSVLAPAGAQHAPTTLLAQA